MSQLNYLGFVATFSFDDESHQYDGTVINSRDVVTFQAADLSELFLAFRDSVDDYLEFCAERGEEPSRFDAHAAP